MNSKQFIEIRNLIENEFSHAVTKHPKFCDFVVNPKTDWSWLEISQKYANDVSAPPYYAENILLEEVAEAMNAYQQRRLDDCLTELAHVGAVAMRCMFFVMAEKLEKENHG